MLSMYIYRHIPPPSPRFKCVSLHTCISRPRDGSSRVLCVHTCIYIRIYVYMHIHVREKNPSSPPRLELRQLFGDGRKTRDKGARDGGRWPWIPGCVCFCRWRSCRFGPVPFYGLHLQRRLLHIEELGLRRIRRLPTGRRRASLRYINTYVSCEAITTPGNYLIVILIDTWFLYSSIIHRSK